jgi:hypothetical protein
MSGVSKRVEDARNKPTKRWNTLERECTPVEQRGKDLTRGSWRRDPGAEADTLGASERVGDAEIAPMKLRNALERLIQRLERKDEEYLPWRAQDDLDNPGGEASCREAPRVTRNAPEATGTSAESRYRGCRAEQNMSRGVEDDRRRQNVGNSIDCDGNDSQTDGATSDTRRESTRLETKSLAEEEQINTNGTSGRERTYLGHPNQLPATPGCPPAI